MYVSHKVLHNADCFLRLEIGKLDVLTLRNFSESWVYEPDVPSVCEDNCVDILSKLVNLIKKVSILKPDTNHSLLSFFHLVKLQEILTTFLFVPLVALNGNTNKEWGGRTRYAPL